jgi:uncharacterized protein (DUF4415 family)
LLVARLAQRGEGMNKAVKESKTSTEKQRREIEALAAMKDEDIDTTDIPEVIDWSKAEVGKFYRPIKKPVSIRLDADVLAWLKMQREGYQTRINSILRRAMMVEYLAASRAPKKPRRKSA